MTGAPRLVIDTNVVLSALLFRSGRLAWLRESWSWKKTCPLVSPETLRELIRVLAYAKFGLSVDEQKTAFAYYMQNAESVPELNMRARTPTCRDPSDAVFLRLAYTASAGALISSDADLLSLASASKIPILTPAELRRRLSL